MRWTIVITAVVGIGAVLIFDGYWSGVLAQGAIFATAALGLTVLTGMTGYVSVGHSALMGIGAYFTARVATDLGWPFELVLVATLVVGVLAGLLFAVPILRLGGHTIALATLALGQIGYLLMLNLIPVTRGPMGIGGIGAPEFAILGGRSLDFPGAMTIVAFGVLIVGLLIVALLQRG